MHPTLKFFSRGTAMVADLEANEAGCRRFIGRRFDPTIGHEGKDRQGQKTMSGGWPATEAPQEVPARAEYVQACKEKSLWPADEATAAYCGVPFDSTFGGEHTL